jgi:hypothetical protein
MKLPMISRPCFLGNDKQNDDKTYFSSTSSVQSDGESVRQGFLPSHSLRSLMTKSKSFLHRTRISEPEVYLPRGGSIEKPTNKDEAYARSKSLLNVAKDAFRSFRITKKKFAADAREALSLDVDEGSITFENEQRRNDLFNVECSALDESMSAHSILDELLIEEYVDPYTDFLKKLERKKGVVEEIEIDKLTPLPSIPMNISRRDKMKSAHRRNSLRYSSPLRKANFETRSLSCISFETETITGINLQKGDHVSWTLKSQYNQESNSVMARSFGDAAMRDITLKNYTYPRSKVSRMSSLPDLSRVETSMYSRSHSYRRKRSAYKLMNSDKHFRRLEL